MNDSEISHARNSLPQSDYFGKANDVAAEYDKLLIGVYSAAIGGTIYLLLPGQVGAWAGGFLFFALAVFVLGMGHALLHVALHSKILFLIEAIKNETAHVPHPLDDEEPTAEAYLRLREYAQRAYSGEIWCVFVGALAAGIGVAVHLWSYASTATLLLIFMLVGAFLFGFIKVVWLRQFPRQRKGRAQN